jgi:hypothetical protein
LQRGQQLSAQGDLAGARKLQEQVLEIHALRFKCDVLWSMLETSMIAVELS